HFTILIGRREQIPVGIIAIGGNGTVRQSLVYYVAGGGECKKCFLATAIDDSDGVAGSIPFETVFFPIEFLAMAHVARVIITKPAHFSLRIDDLLKPLRFRTPM